MMMIRVNRTVTNNQFENQQQSAVPPGHHRPSRVNMPSLHPVKTRQVMKINPYLAIVYFFVLPDCLRRASAKVLDFDSVKHDKSGYPLWIVFGNVRVSCQLVLAGCVSQSSCFFSGKPST